MTMVRVGRTKKMMKMQPTTGLRYLASRVDGGEDDVVVSVGCLHPGTLQCGSVRGVEVSRFSIQLLRWPSPGPPRQRPYTHATAISSFRAINQQSAGSAGTVVGWERRHSRRSLTRANIGGASASRRWGGIVVWGGRLVGGPVDQALKIRLSWRACAPHHHCDFIGTVSMRRQKDDGQQNLEECKTTDLLFV